MQPNDPSADGLDLRTPEEMEASIRMRLAGKRKAKEWFEIWREVVEYGVHQVIRANPSQRGLIMENLRARRPLYAKVESEFAAMELDFKEAFKVSGLVYDDVEGTWSMPSGTLTIQLLTRKETVTFRGDRAIVAFGFFQWWHAFKDTIDPLAIGKAPRLL